MYDPSGDGNISETARRGAIAQVAACAETVRNGKTTWAYQLTSGDWVLAYNVQEVEGGAASFTGAQARVQRARRTFAVQRQRHTRWPIQTKLKTRSACAFTAQNLRQILPSAALPWCAGAR